MGSILGLLTAAVITYVMPRQYESEAVIQIPVFLLGTGSSERAMSTQCEVLTSGRILADVVESLEMSSHWNLDVNTCIETLQSIVRAHPLRETDLVSIRCRHPNPVDARDIANEVAASYNRHFKDLRALSNERSELERMKALRQQEDRVEETRMVLNVLIRNREKQAAQPAGSSGKIDDGTRETLAAMDLKEAEREHETEAEILKAMKLKQASEHFGEDLHSDPILVHQDALIANKPISPNVSRNLALGASAGLFSGLLSSLVRGRR